MSNSNRRLAGIISIAVMLWSPVAFSDDATTIAAILDDFLAGVNDAETHQRFWADDLIYTSSSGTRTNKAEIMQGFSDPAGADAGTRYSAEDVRIQLYGTTAIVAFRLVASSEGDAMTQEYLNTGTFLYRNGLWQAVAWQATRIPPAK
jgi:hypothetical protein